jgi:hypothetical protein
MARSTISSNERNDRRTRGQWRSLFWAYVGYVRFSIFLCTMPSSGTWKVNNWSSSQAQFRMRAMRSVLGAAGVDELVHGTIA